MWDDMGIRGTAALQAHDHTYRAWARERLRTGKLLGWIAETNGEPVVSACLWLQPTRPTPNIKGKTTPYLLSMYTEPKHRGKGIRTQILNQANLLTASSLKNAE
jgi:GNAT superfamily N-acetyltransferase